MIKRGGVLFFALGLIILAACSSEEKQVSASCTEYYRCYENTVQKCCGYPPRCASLIDCSATGEQCVMQGDRAVCRVVSDDTDEKPDVDTVTPQNHNGSKEYVKEWSLSIEGDYSYEDVSLDESDNAIYLAVNIDRVIDSDSTQKARFWKYSTDGEILWKKEWLLGEFTEITSCAVNTAGVVWTVSTYINADESAGRDDLLRAYTPDGSMMFSRDLFRKTDEIRIHDVLSTGADFFLIGTDMDGYQRIYLYRFTQDGVLQWKKALDEYFNNRIVADTAPDGGVVLAYHVMESGAPYCGPQDLCTDIRVLRVTAEGEKMWRHTAATVKQHDTAEDIVFDNNGGVYLSGETYGAMYNNTHHGGRDMFLVRFTSAGAVDWSYQYGSPDNESGSSVLSLCGDGVLTTIYDSDVMEWFYPAVYYAEDGTEQWRINDNDDLGKLRSIEADCDGNLYIASGEAITKYRIKDRVEHFGNGPCEDRSWYYDTYKGLAWSCVSPGTTDHYSATAYCEDNGWHLPTISELRTLIQNCPDTEIGGACGVTDECLSWSDCWDHDTCRGCSDDGSGEYSVFGDNQSFWSSSVVADNTTDAWQVIFTNDRIKNGDRHNTSFVRCVRDPETLR